MTRFRSGPPVLAVIAVSALLRLLFASLTGLGIDESYTVAVGRDIQLSYFDHPPLVWWLSWGAAHLFGSTAPEIVRLPFIALFALSTWLLYRLTAILYSPAAGRWAALIFNLAPVFGVTTASWVLPDGPLVAALLGLMICLARVTAATQSGRPWLLWLGAGLCAGLALLSKYSTVLVLFGAAIAFLTHSKHRQWLFRPHPWAAISLAALMFSPVILWNAHHDWCSFAFQSGRAHGAEWHPFRPIVTFGGEAAFLLPWIWAGLMVQLAFAWRKGRAAWAGWLLALSGTPPVVLFSIVSLWAHGRILFHWAAPGYLMLFPLLGAAMARWMRTSHRRLIRGAVTATSIFVISAAGLAASEIRWNWLPAEAKHISSGVDSDLAAVDWSSIGEELHRRGWTDGGAVIAVPRWYYAGKLDYALGGRATVVCLGDDPREYGIAHPISLFQGRDMLILAPGSNSQSPTSFSRFFEAVEPQPPLTLLHNGKTAMTFSVYLGRRFVGEQVKEALADN